MKKENKKIIITIVALVLIICIGVILFIVLNNKNNKTPETSNVYLSLSGEGQATIDNEIKANLEKNKYKLENAAVYINPYGNSPLSAMITFHTSSKVSVEVIVKGKNDNDLKIEYDEKTNYHYVPVFGLYSDETNSVTIKLSNGDSHTFEIKTEKILEGFDISANSNNKDETNGIYFITSPITMSTIGIDAYGYIRWYNNSLYYHGVEVLENGHILIGTNSMNMYGLSTELLEIDYLGRIYKRYTIDEGYLNDFFIKSDGNILLASKSSERDTYSDVIIEIDKETGKIIKSIDIFDLFSKIDKSFTNNLVPTFFYNSGIQYYEDTDTLLLTYWSGEFVISLDYSDNNINWIFSNPDNFTSAFNEYLLTTNDGVYPKAMHSATLNGNVLKVFDNGYSTNSGETNVSNLKGSYSSANTYEISSKTIKLNTILDEEKKNFSYALGDYEITKDSEIVLYGRELNNLDYNSGIDINEHIDLSSKLIEYKNNKKIVELDIHAASYSVNKISLSGKYNFEFIDESNLTTLKATVGEELTEEIINGVKNASSTGDFGFGYSNGIIENNIVFMDSDEAKLVLMDSNDKGIVYTLKSKDNEVRKILTDLGEGKYDIYVIINNVYYKTDQYIEIN